MASSSYSSVELNERYGSDGRTGSVLFTESGADSVVANREGGKRRMFSFRDFFRSAFLPQGYPDSVSEDYLEYQMWDTMQAFCSSITGTLAMQAMLKGYGVGDKSATAAGATLTWMMKDGAGMLGRISFAWLKGTQLDCDAKRWRLFADVLNDFAMFLELLAPLFKGWFSLIVCIAGVSKSIVGVAGGATRAALTQHQARRDNMADVSAKDGSQETLVNLMALLAGFIITPLVADNQPLVWFLFVVFTFLHLFANYKAVSAVVMEAINLPRLRILLLEYIQHGQTLKPRDVAILDPVLRGPGYKRAIEIGASISSLTRGSTSVNSFASDRRKSYIIGVTPRSPFRFSGTVHVALHRDCTEQDVFKSGIAAILLDMALERHILPDNIHIEKLYGISALQSLSRLCTSDSAQKIGQVIDLVEETTDLIYPRFIKELENCGWIVPRTHFGQDEWRFAWPEDSAIKKDM